MSTATEGPQGHINLAELSLQQLAQVKHQLDQELTVFQDSLQTLKVAQNKYQESGSCLEKVKPETKGTFRFI